MNTSVLQPGGPVAQQIAGLSWLLFIGAAVIFLAVMLLLAWALRGRAADAPPRVRLWLLGGGVLFPGAVLAALFIHVLPLTPVRQVAPANALLVTVTGRMWWWEVRYPAAPGQGEIVAANEIRIPVGRPVWIALASDDVIHSFWVPALAGKVDMVPGRRHQLLLSADRPGVYRGQCAEFCGQQHALMALHVVALAPAEFEAWRQAQLLPAAAAETPQLARGRDAFLANRCDACHTVRGVAESGRLGPDLTHVGSRLQLGAGTLANSPAALAGWVAHVQQLKPGARMPSYDRLDAVTLAALGDWLGVAAVTAGPPDAMDPRLRGDDGGVRGAGDGARRMDARVGGPDRTAGADDRPRFPSSLPRPAGEREALVRAWQPPRGWRRLTAVNNTQVGIMYIATALLFFVLAGVLALVMRAQLALPDNTLVSAATYNQLFTMHGTVMMFLFAVPVVEAFAVYLLPGMLGARDLPFPRLSAYAFWAYAIGGSVFFCTIFFGASPDGGWFMYPPLTGKEHSPGIGADWWLLGIGFIEISAIAGAVELIIGILFTRAPGMTLMKMPVFAWAMLVTAFMIVFAFPAIIAGTLLLEMERAFDWPIFIPARGGDPVLWQHLFWFFGHPEVYIIFLPAAGMVSMMVPALVQTRLVGYRAVVWALVGVGVISFGLWIHHMFTAGLGSLALHLASAASFAVAIPSAVQVFAWIATFWRGRVQPDAPTLFLLGFHFIFVLGGLTGVMVAVLPFDWQVHDSYFIVAHLHYVLIGGMVFPVFAGLYYWAPVFNGHRLDERHARWVFGAMFVGFNTAFFPMHITGLLGMPRRVASYADGLGWNGLNMLSTVGAFLFAAGVALCLFDLWRALRKPAQPHDNPWHAPTLEWLPANEYGVRSVPQVASREPLWEQPALPQQVEDGRHWLPGTVFGGRETLVTSVVGAELRHLLRLPGDGWLPFVAAAGTAGFFLLLTVSWVWSAFGFGLLALVAIIGWLWQSDQPPPADRALVGDEVRLPVGAVGRQSHSYWGMVVWLAVDATIFASLAFAHLHVSMALQVCPPPGAALPALPWPLASSLLLLSGSALLLLAQSRVVRSRQGGLRLALVVAMGCVAASFGVDLASHLVTGLEPRATAWGATVAALLAWQGLHALLLLVMGGYLVVRSWRRKLLPRARASIDNTALQWHYVTLQGLAISGLTQLLPRLLG